MSRYTPPRGRDTTGDKAARSPSGGRVKRGKAAKKSKPKPRGPTPFVCGVCQRGFRTEEALAVHGRDAHDQTIDLKKLSPLSPRMVRCPDCAAPVSKRNLYAHRSQIHGIGEGI